MRKFTALATYAVLACGLIGTAQAETQAEIESLSSVPADAKYAVVYFANTLPGWGGIGSKGKKIQVFVDGDPIGLLAHGTCTVAQVEAGFHDVYPYQWLFFEGGRTYLLRTRGGLGDWLLDDTANLAATDCEQYELTPADRQKLEGERWLRKYAKDRETGWQHYEEFIERVGVSPPQLLPLTATNSQYLEGPDQKRVGGLVGSGKLTIDQDGIQWERGENTLKIEAAEIRQVSFSRYQFVHVAYGDPDDLRHAHLSGDVWKPRLFYRGSMPLPGEHYNLIFLAIVQAAMLAQS